jgi:hypothetical protein
LIVNAKSRPGVPGGATPARAAALCAAPTAC